MIIDQLMRHDCRAYFQAISDSIAAVVGKCEKRQNIQKRKKNEKSDKKFIEINKKSNQKKTKITHKKAMVLSSGYSPRVKKKNVLYTLCSACY